MEKVIVIGILEDEKGNTVGARVQNSFGEKQNFTTSEIQSFRVFWECSNATIDKNGFVRAKNGYLERIYIQTNFRGIEKGIQKEATKLLEPNIIEVYHGNKNKDMVPKYDYGKSEYDYGSGFYLTPNIELAKEWSQSSYSVGTSYLHSYTLDLEGLEVLDLTKISAKYWIAELLYNRNFGRAKLRHRLRIKKYVEKYRYKNIDSFDIIIGYRADDSFFRYMYDFLDGVITEEELRDSFQYGNLGLQICLKSEKSFEQLRKVNKVHTVNIGYKQKYINRDKKAKQDYDNLIMSLEYKNERKEVCSYIKSWRVNKMDIDKDVETKQNCYDIVYLWEDMENMGDMFEYCNKFIKDKFGVEIDEIKFLTAYMKSLNREAMEQGHPRLCSQAPESTLHMFVTIDLEGNLEAFKRTEEYYFEESQLYWVGWIYAFLHYEEDIKSKDLVEILTIEDMLDFYITGHQMAESTFYNRIKWKFEK